MTLRAFFRQLSCRHKVYVEDITISATTSKPRALSAARNYRQVTA